MTLRDTNPQRLEALMREVEEEWANNNGDERVQQTWMSFVQVFQLVAAIAWDIEASRGNLGDPNPISVKGRVKLYHWGVNGQGKCPAKCSG